MESPRLTVVLASRTGLRESRAALEQLRRQTLARDLEVILVAPRGLVNDAELQGFTGFESIRLLELDRVDNRGEAAAHALLQARAPFAGPRENHSFAEPDAFETVLHDWQPDDDVVAPAIRSANPDTQRSLATYLATYGPAAAPADPRPRQDLPHHTAVFRTDVLKAMGDRLPELMADESRLHAELRRRGYRLRLNPRAIVWHVNESRWIRTLTYPFILGLKLGAARTAEASWVKRLAYVLAFPLIAILRFRGLLEMARRADDTRTVVWSLVPMLVLIALIAAIGEAWGYIWPGTPLPEDVDIHEFHIRGRFDGVTPGTPWVKDLVDRLPNDID